MYLLRLLSEWNGQILSTFSSKVLYASVKQRIFSGKMFSQLSLVVNFDRYWQTMELV